MSRCCGRFREQNHLGSQHPFRFKNRLLSLDSTTISLCLSLFPWAAYRQAKGGVKLHVLLSHDDYLPEYAVITEARRPDLGPARQMRLRPGSIVVADRGYVDFALFHRWTGDGVYWVTRMKDGIAFGVEESRDLPQGHTILADQVISLCGATAAAKYPATLRRIVVWDPEQRRQIEVLTNHFGFGATTLARIYRERWQIELFFKALKQNLKIKTFVGTSENALRIQIWTALVALLLLKWLHYLSAARWSLSNLASLLRLNLFTYRDLREWLDHALETPPLLPSPEQIGLALPVLDSFRNDPPDLDLGGAQSGLSSPPITPLWSPGHGVLGQRRSRDWLIANGGAIDERHCESMSPRLPQGPQVPCARPDFSRSGCQ